MELFRPIFTDEKYVQLDGSGTYQAVGGDTDTCYEVEVFDSPDGRVTVKKSEGSSDVEIEVPQGRSMLFRCIGRGSNIEVKFSSASSGTIHAAMRSFQEKFDRS